MRVFSSCYRAFVIYYQVPAAVSLGLWPWIAGPVAVGLLRLSSSYRWACGRGLLSRARGLARPVAVDCWACGRRIAGPVAVEGNVGGSHN